MESDMEGYRNMEEYRAALRHTVLFKRLNPDAQLPAYANAGDSGMDLVSVDNAFLMPGEHVMVKTGLSVELPGGHEGQVRPRSGLAVKYGITVLNAPGTVDCGYRGEIGVVLVNHGSNPFQVSKGMRVAQLVIVPVQQFNVRFVSGLSDTERGAGGFGSSGEAATGL
jgi:dUTP pyrophosphatase